MRLAFPITALGAINILMLLCMAQVNAASREPVRKHRFNNAIAVGVSANVGNQDSNGIGLNLIEYGRRIHGHWFASVALGLDRKWTQTGSGTEQIETKSVTAQLSYGLRKINFFNLRTGMAVFAAVSQDFSSFNVATGLYNQDLGTTVGGGVSFAFPTSNRWAVFFTPQVGYDLTSTELSFETEIGLAYAF